MFRRIAWWRFRLNSSRLLDAFWQSGLEDGGERTGVVLVEPEERCEEVGG